MLFNILYYTIYQVHKMPPYRTNANEIWLWFRLTGLSILYIGAGMLLTQKDGLPQGFHKKGNVSAGRADFARRSSLVAGKRLLRYRKNTGISQ
jgi:hypothetical protein